MLMSRVTWQMGPDIFHGTLRLSEQVDGARQECVQKAFLLPGSKVRGKGA